VLVSDEVGTTSRRSNASTTLMVGHSLTRMRQSANNVSENPRDTALAFVREHGLSENYIDTIAEFIQRHLAMK